MWLLPSLLPALVLGVSAAAAASYPTDSLDSTTSRAPILADGGVGVPQDRTSSSTTPRTVVVLLPDALPGAPVAPPAPDNRLYVAYGPHRAGAPRRSRRDTVFRPMFASRYRTERLKHFGRSGVPRRGR